MNTNDLISNLKYYGKYFVIIIIIFILLKFVMSLKFYEALLLSLIIAVSILIIENIIYINDIAMDPLNCDQCKVNINSNQTDNVNNVDNVDNINLLNMVPNPLAESEQIIEVKEPFISDTIEKIINNVSDTLKNNPNTNKLAQQIINNVKSDVKLDDMYDLKCIKVNKDNTTKSEKNEQEQRYNKNQTTESAELTDLEILKRKIEELERKQNINQPNDNSDRIEGFNNIESNEPENDHVNNFANDLENDLDQFISNQQNKNKNLISKLKSQPKIQAVQNKIAQAIQETQETQETKANRVKQIEESLENPYLARAELLNKPKELEELNKLDSKPKLNPNAEYNLDTPITYDAGYVQYQQDGLQKQENDVSFDNTLFRMGIGQENIVKPFMRDGSVYYNRIQSYSSKAPTPQEALNSELRYGDYNYISPLNSGMTNSDYTFVSPNNWYPVPPHPPVCVTNKQCTTSPIMISDGQDWMNWATLEDFDKARRFTGNMGINIDYVKNVLNNDEGY